MTNKIEENKNFLRTVREQIKKLKEEGKFTEHEELEFWNKYDCLIMGRDKVVKKINRVNKFILKPAEAPKNLPDKDDLLRQVEALMVQFDGLIKALFTKQSS